MQRSVRSLIAFKWWKLFYTHYIWRGWEIRIAMQISKSMGIFVSCVFVLFGLVCIYLEFHFQIYLFFFENLAKTTIARKTFWFGRICASASVLLFARTHCMRDIHNLQWICMHLGRMTQNRITDLFKKWRTSNISWNIFSPSVSSISSNIFMRIFFFSSVQQSFFRLFFLSCFFFVFSFV